MQILNSVKTFFNNTSIRYKLIAYFLLVIAFPIFTLGVIGNLIYSRTIELEATENTMQMIEQVNKNLELYAEKMENVIEYISREPEIVEFMKIASMNDSKRINVETEVRNTLRSIKDTYPEIAGLLVANDNNIYISNELYRVKRDSLSKDEWYRLASINPGTVQLLSKPINRNIATSLNYTADDIISITKAIIDPTTKKFLGVILIDMKIDTIKNVIESVTFGKSGFVYVMDSNGDIIYTALNKIVYRIKEQWLSNNLKNSLVKNIRNTRYQILYSTSEYTKWKTVGAFSLDETLEPVMYVRYFTLFIAVLTFILAVFIILYFTDRVVKPINKLRNLMKIVENGNFDIKFNSDSNDEIGQLGNGFNNMLNEIKKLIKMLYIEQKRKLEAQIRILQSQIKPHFLYNTLDNIQWMAQEHNADDIVETVGALTTLFRHTISKDNEMIKVKDELEHIKSYLFIQKVRYEDKLEYNIDFNDDILELLMHRLSLQPLVENAIYHGIKLKRGAGKIEVIGKILDDKLYFSVKDDGVGIKKERLNEINEMLIGNMVDKESLGYGIFNVNERIKLSFGDEYGLKYTSIYGEGTKVEVYYPIIKDGENNVEDIDSR